MLEAVFAWGEAFFLPLGALGLFIVAFMESSFFPVPPDVLLIPLVVINPQLAIFYAVVTTLGSVLGGVAGYYIGHKGGRPVAQKFFSDRHINKVESYFEGYGSWAVMIAGLTPIPYKVFTIASGMAKMNMRSFIFASVAGRGMRFFIEAIVLMMWGEAILSIFFRYFEMAAVGLVVGVVGMLLLRKKVKS